MGSFKNIFAVIAIGIMAAACSTDEVAKMSVKGGAYEKGLRDGYIKLARAEYKEDDFGDAGAFVDRAKMAAMGKPTGPEELNARKLVSKHKKPLANARKRLTQAYAAGGIKKAPKHAAEAQVQFDCWMQEAEENLQKRDIQKCRSAFYGAMALLEAAVEQPVMMEKPMKMTRQLLTRNFIVYFDSNSAKISKDGASEIKGVKSFIKRRKISRITVVGHTDRSGSNSYNAKLAAARADAVAAGLVKAGIKKGLVKTVVWGESKPAVKTQDGAKNAKNRRVVIGVTY
jgi:outer membrane protein OmpA-like peptidoglycan-associated protein